MCQSGLPPEAEALPPEDHPFSRFQMLSSGTSLCYSGFSQYHVKLNSKQPRMNRNSSPMAPGAFQFDRVRVGLC